jgi:hypothetical protein
MAPKRRALHELQMASPCSADWDEMKGTARVRQCHRCRRSVYRISDLNREAAEDLIEDVEGERCTSLFRRTDGTVLVEDCPPGAAAARRASRWWKERMFHLLLLVLPWLILTGFISIDSETRKGDFSLSSIEPYKSLGKLLSSRPVAAGGLKPIRMAPAAWPPGGGGGMPAGGWGGPLNDPDDGGIFPPPGGPAEPPQ